MSPVLIEDAIRVETPLIAQCVAIGNARSYVVALITLDSVELTLFTKNRGIELPPLASAIELPEVAAEIAAAVDRGNKKLSRAEQVKTYRVLADEWVPDSDELTPTAKLRRNQIEAKYIAEIDALYA
jgi:long-subunit acyl-CoA synthetase (AMP-forming)